ncbi:class II histocompatibility antigen, B-L beta chain-like, partial [Pipra filicauda]|uniref:Class II histocompatibility antigen, B-L beta chain-like n=1 Tax=Pipra filicauda TaxID=649802 RepID=A0A7R5L5X9_9PASS
PAAGEELSGVFQEMLKFECHFINGTERVRNVLRKIYNREQYVHFDSDVGVFVGDTPYGEKFAKKWNSDQEWLEYARSLVDTCCPQNYKLYTPFSVERREMPPDTVRSKILVGVGGFVLGLVFLALGLGFYLWEKIKGGSSAVLSPPCPQSCPVSSHYDSSHSQSDTSLSE